MGFILLESISTQLLEQAFSQALVRPSIIFVKDANNIPLDSSQHLLQLISIKNPRILLIAVTNSEAQVSPKLISSSVFHSNVTIDLPNVQERAQILKINCSKMQLHSSVNFCYTPGSQRENRG